MNYKFYIFFILSITSLTSCSNFINFIDDGHVVSTAQSPQTLSLIFSHNINGQLLSCNCGENALGGIAQIAAKFNFIRQNSDKVLYVDTGDALFSSPQMSMTFEKSALYSAENILQSFKLLGLNLFLPGDNDFAAGTSILEKIEKQTSALTVISNLASDSKILKQNVAWHKYDSGASRIYFMGIIEPSLLTSSNRHFLTDPFSAIAQALQQIENDGYDAKNPFQRLILLSHSGIDFDKTLPLLFPQIDWIIGAHSQSHTTTPLKIGNTQIVQVLSKGQHLGEIQMNLASGKNDDHFITHEVREEHVIKYIDHPMIEFEQRYKENITKIQKEEILKTAPTISYMEKMSEENLKECQDCHQTQISFWQKSKHRNLPNLCLACHQLDDGHPFNVKNSPQGPEILEEKSLERKNRCLNCHPKDSALPDKKFQERLHKVACPSAN